MEEHLAITVKGVKVLGRASSHDGWDLSVEMDSPYPGYSDDRHTMLIARRPPAQRRVDPDNRLTKEAVRFAKSLLRSLYNRIKFLDDHSEQLFILARRRIGYISGLFGGTLDQDWLYNERTWLRSLLKSRAIDSTVYQRKLMQAKAQAFGYQFSLMEDLEQQVQSELRKSLDSVLPDSSYFVFQAYYRRRFRPWSIEDLDDDYDDDSDDFDAPGHSPESSNQ